MIEPQLLLSHALAAPPVATRFNFEVGPAQRMALIAYRLSGIDSSKALAAKNVYLERNRLQVRGANTPSITTEMVNRKPLRDGADIQDVRLPMGKDGHPPGTAPRSELSIPLDVDVALPLPAAITLLNEGPEALLYGSATCTLESHREARPFVATGTAAPTARPPFGASIFSHSDDGSIWVKGEA